MLAFRSIPLIFGVLLWSFAPVAVCAQQEPRTFSPTFAAYPGGSGAEAVAAVASDSSGGLYVAGYTASGDFGLGGMLGTYAGGATDAFVARMDTTGALERLLLLGGAGEDVVTGLAVDTAGVVFVAGSTTSADFPAAGRYGPFRGGDQLGTDGFVARLAPDLSAVEAAAFVGGGGDDIVTGLVLDRRGRAVVAGLTSSTDLITTPGALQARHAGGLLYRSDAFVGRIALGSDTVAVEMLTYYGGSGDDQATALDLLADGRPVVVGATTSADLPATMVPQPRYAGPMRPPEGDAFVAVFDTAGAVVPWASYLGGRGDDWATQVVAGGADRVHVAGWTASDDFPAAGGSAAGGGQDAFVVTYTVGGSTGAVEAVSRIGGRGDEQALALTRGADGALWLGGLTTSADLPMRGRDGLLPLQSFYAGGPADGFLLRLDARTHMLDWSTWLGGSGADAIVGLAGTGDGGVCTAGATGSGTMAAAPSAGRAEGVGRPEKLDQAAFVLCLALGSLPTDAEAMPPPAAQTALHGNYPNPFNPSTTLAFDVARPGRVQLEVYDVLGRLVARLADGHYAAGSYRIPLDASGWASGTYFYRLRADGFGRTRSMVLVK